MKHKESQIQRAAVACFRLKYPKLALNLIAIPNGGARTAVEASILKAEGVVAGASDLFLFYPSSKHHGLAIEMKTEHGKQTERQKAWQDAVEKAGYRYEVCRSASGFLELIEEYLNE